jgi:hypothetical protein
MLDWSWKRAPPLVRVNTIAKVDLMLTEERTHEGCELVCSFRSGFRRCRGH